MAADFNTVKAEVDYMRVTGVSTSTDFIPMQTGRPQIPAQLDGQTTTATGTKTVAGNVTTHKLR